MGGSTSTAQSTESLLQSRGIQVPTIIISAHGDGGARQRCISAGALAFLSKPLQDTELLAATGATSELGRRKHEIPGRKAGRDALIRPFLCEAYRRR